MKKIFLPFILFIMTATVLNAQGTEKIRKWVVDIGFSTHIPNEGAYPGIMFGAGYYISPQNRLSIDFGAHFKGIQIGTFDYSVSTGGKMEHFTDGEIKRVYTFMPMLLSWGHEFVLSNKLKLRVGPAIGINSLSANNTYTSKSHDLTDMQGKPDDFSTETSVFTGGAVLALDWRLFKPSGIAFTYRLLANESKEFELIKVNAVTNTIGVSYWWKF
jgi:hypothetical protein